jgi:hypothetical protein
LSYLARDSPWIVPGGRKAVKISLLFGETAGPPKRAAAE